MAQVVCQVVHRPGRMSVLWSMGATAFEPIHLEGDQLAAFDQLARRARQTLARSCHGDQGAAGELAAIGRDLHAAFFAGGVGAEVDNWLVGLTGVESIEIGTDSPGSVPFALFEDRAGPWGRRFALTAGRRVNLLHTYPHLQQPSLLVAGDPGVMDALDEGTRAALEGFVVAKGGRAVKSRQALEASLRLNVPDVIWILARLEHGAWLFGNDRVTPQDIEATLREAAAGNSLPVIVSTAVAGPEATTSWECVLGAASAALPGLVALETPAPAAAAMDIGLSFFKAFLDDRQPIARAVLAVRDRAAGMALASYAPPQVRVVTADDPPAAGPKARPLPPEPYHPLRPLEREERALLFGRDDAIEACGRLLDQPNTAGLIVHGRGGAGKASFVRAGLLPYLEEENRCFYVLRDRTEATTEEAAEETTDELSQPTLALRTGYDLAGSIIQGILAFAAQPYQYTTPTGRTVRVDLPAILRGFAGIGTSSEAVQSAESAPVAPGPIQVTPSAVHSVVSARPAALGELLDNLTRSLPFVLLLPIEHLEDLCTLTEFETSAQSKTVVFDTLSRSPARVQTVATARTELFGQVQGLFGQDYARAAWKDFYLTELTWDDVEQVMKAPTLTTPLPYAQTIPAATYGFGFEPLAEAKVRDAAKKSTSYSPLQIVHALGAQLFADCRKRDVPAARIADVTPLVKYGPIESLVRTTIQSVGLSSADARSLRGFFPKMFTTTNGVVVGTLAAVSQLRSGWTSVLPLEKAINRAAVKGLFDVQTLPADGQSQSFVSLGSDLLDRFGEAEKQVKSAKTFARSRVIDWMFIVIPLAVVGMALTYYLANVRFKNSNTAERQAIIMELERREKLNDLTARSAKFASYAGFLAQAEADIRQGNTLRARQTLLTQQPEISDRKLADIRGFEWYALWRRIAGEDGSIIGHMAPVLTLALSPDQTRLASGDQSGRILYWDVKNLVEPAIAELPATKRGVVSLAISADGTSLASADGSPAVLVWQNLPKPAKDVIEHPPASVLRAESPARAVAFVGKKVAVGQQSGAVTLFDIAEKDKSVTGKEHDGPVDGIAPVGTSVASVSRDKVVLWDESGKKTTSAKLTLAEVAGLVPAPGGGVWIVGTSTESGHAEGVVLEWDGKSETTSLRATHGIGALAAASLGENLIATAGKDQIIRVNEMGKSSRQVGQVLGHLSWVRALVGGPDVLVSASYDNTIKVWDPKKALAPDSIAAHDSVSAVAFNTSQKLLASAGHDGFIRFWDPTTGVKLGEAKAAGPIAALEFGGKDHPDLLVAAVGNDAQVFEIALQDDTVTAKPGATLSKHKEPITCLSIEGGRLVTGGRDKAAVAWSLPDGKTSKVIKCPEAITSIAWVEKLIVAGDASGAVLIFDADGQLEARPVSIHFGPVHAATLVKQQLLKGPVFGSVSDDQTFKIWKLMKDQPTSLIRAYRGHNQSVTCLVQGAGFFATGGADGTVKTWDYSLDEERCTFAGPAPAAAVRTLALAPRLALIVAGDDAGRLRFIRGIRRESYGPVGQFGATRIEQEGDN